MDTDIEITVGDVTDMEAYVYARYVGSEDVVLRGTIRGPFCERGRTLPADFSFQPSKGRADSAEALITEPCIWSAEMPQLYRVDLVATKGDRVISEYHGTIGLNRLAPRRPVDFAPGTG